jgi:hypothetical protein
VCGFNVENLSDKLKKLADFYGVDGKPRPAELLFALHTYYAVVIKLLASEIVSFFNPWMTRQVERLQSATTPGKLKRELEAWKRAAYSTQQRQLLEKAFLTQRGTSAIAIPTASVSRSCHRNLGRARPYLRSSSRSHCLFSVSETGGRITALSPCGPDADLTPSAGESADFRRAEAPR